MIAEKTAGILERVRLVKDEAFLDAVTDILDAYLRAQSIAESVDEHDPVLGTRPNGEEVRADQARAEYTRRKESMKKGNFTTVAQLREEKNHGSVYCQNKHGSW